ncbi:hypothetical protein M5K25_021638 [Dendrobium thyrsiflorum]|uniref:TOG domain-containing protein n=1 Tax=Dendrobium thyrsiflorum TaxID=117978 RepID=A0ABD0UDJ0_DENTH
MRSQRMSLKVKGSGRMVTPQQAIYELKHRVVLSLNKIADRDTYQLGVEELEKIAEGLTPEGIFPFLSCIIDTDSEQKSAVRKECIKVLGTLARFHGNLMSAHVGKMVASIIKRLKDSDSTVRDACVETAGILTMTMGSSGGGENGFVALVKPFFEALGEQNRYVQTGSSLCLTRVIDEAREPPITLLAQMLTRVVKLLKNQHFMAKPALIELIRSIVQAGGASTDNALHLAVTSIAEALKCNDWTTRKAASLALAGIAASVGSAVGYLKTSCICSLESCRFDKVKPVRDAVVHALQCWKALPGTDSCDPSEAGSSTKDIINGDYTDLTCTSDGGWRHSTSKTSSMSALSGTSSNSTKKRTPLTIRKNCPNQMHDYQHKDSNEWHIEVSLPKSHITFSTDDNHEELQRSTIRKEHLTNENATRCWHATYERDIIEEKTISSNMSNFISESCETKHAAANNEYLDEGSSANINTIDSGPVTEEIDSEGFRILECNSMDSTVTDVASHGLRGCCLHVSNELAFIRKQLLDIKTKQSKMLNLFEVFVGNTTSTLSTLHSKVENLEGTVDELTQTCAQKGRNLNIEGLKYLKKNQSETSSPRLSTCTPRPSFDCRPHSMLSSNRTQLCKDKLLSRSESNSSAKDGLDLWRDPTSKLIRSPVGIDVQKNMGRRKVKENENLFSVLTSSVSSKQENFDNEAISWKIINDYMRDRDVESIYQETLSSGDDVSLLELMNRTGPVLENLSPEVASQVLGILTRKFLNHSFMPSMIPWLQQVVDLSHFQGPKQPFLSKKGQMEFLYALKGMAEVDYINHGDRISIAQFAVKLSKLWGEAASRRIPLPRGPNESIRPGKTAKV